MIFRCSISSLSILGSALARLNVRARACGTAEPWAWRLLLLSNCEPRTSEKADQFVMLDLDGDLVSASDSTESNTSGQVQSKGKTAI